jgi:hypothetical protein
MVGFFVRAGKALKEGTKTIEITPLKKILGSKTVEQHKKKISDIKDRKKYSDELEAAGAKLIDTVNQTGKSLNQLNETLKKGALKKVKEGK